MKKILGFLFKTHKITGTAIAVFFLMWFITGLVLVYHPYPKVSERLLYDKKETLSSSLPPISSILFRLDGKISGLSLKQFQGQTLFMIKTKDSTWVCEADPTKEVKPITFSVVEQVAKHWIDAPIKKVDTLYQREQWVLFTKYDKALPIYKFYFDDKEKHELFISGKTAEVLQMTTARQRFWSWVGAIPHKFYIPCIRRNVDVWQNTVSIVSAICLLAALSGWLLGLILWIKLYLKKQVWKNPFKKRWYRWHFSFGLIFGLFLIAWATSGIFAMQRVPQWLVPMEGDYSFKNTRLWGRGLLPMDAYQLDYRMLKDSFPDLKELEWTRYSNIPAYRIVTGTEELLIDASGKEIKRLQIPEQTIIEGLKKIHGKEVGMKVTLLNEFDNYYLSRRVSLSLPVYKIEVADTNGSLYYVNPSTGYVRYLNNNKIVRKWLFNATHYLDMDWLVSRPWLWHLSLWVLCSGCLVVCVSGLILGCKVLFSKKKKCV